MNAFRSQKIKYNIKERHAHKIFSNHSLQNLVIKCEGGKEEEVNGDSSDNCG